MIGAGIGWLLGWSARWSLRASRQDAARLKRRVWLHWSAGALGLGGVCAGAGFAFGNGVPLNGDPVGLFGVLSGIAVIALATGLATAAASLWGLQRALATAAPSEGGDRPCRGLAVRRGRWLPRRWARNAMLGAALILAWPAYLTIEREATAYMMFVAVGVWAGLLALCGAVGYALGWMASRVGVVRRVAPVYDVSSRPIPQAWVDIVPESRRPRPQQRISGRGNIIARHWRGEYKLWAAYWITGLVGTFAVLLFGRTLTFALNIHSYEPLRVFVQIGAIWAFTLLVSTWSLVGVWRAAGRHAAARNQLPWRALWPALARASVVLGAMRIAFDLGTAAVPQVAETVRMAFLGDPEIPAYRLRLLRGATEIEVTGGFKYGLAEDLRRVLDAAPQVKVMHLHSPGGRIGEAVKVGKLIAQRGIATYAVAECASACAIAFIAARNRWLHADALLGFHAGAFPGIKDQRPVDEAIRRPLADAGVMPSFIARALATPHEDMWYPEQSALIGAHVATGVAQAGQFALSGLGADADREEVKYFLLRRDNLYAVLETIVPEAFAGVLAAWEGGYLRGDSETDIEAKAQPVIAEAVMRRRHLADDPVVLDWARLAIDQAEHLARREPRLCFDYFAAKPGLGDFTRMLPPALVERERDLAARVLASAVPRPAIDRSAAQRYNEVVLGQLQQRFGTQVQLLSSRLTEASQYADYCRVSIEMIREVLALGEPGASTMLRQIFAPGRL